MNDFLFRPWGHIDWLFDRYPRIDWSFLGCLGTEERSISAWARVAARKMPTHTWLLKIADLPSRHSALSKTRFEERLAQLVTLGGNVSWVKEHSLLEAHSDIVGIVEEVTSLSSNVIFDITSLPKRFFFPLLRLFLLRPKSIQNLVLTYTFAKEYSSEKLSENFNDWAQLPLFTGKYFNSAASMLIVSVGFEVLGLQERVEHGEDGLPIKLLVPYPARSAAFLRSWEVARQLQKHRPREVFEVFRVDPTDVSDVFDRVVTLTQAGSKRAEFAPFGPKPISAGMCIFATLTDSEVFFNQPTVYHPDYSTGIFEKNGRPEIFAYSVRLQGKDFYRV